MKIINTYKEKGITVKVLKGCEFVPRPARKEIKQKIKNATRSEVAKIRNWANAGVYNSGRRIKLAGVTGIGVNRVRSLLSPPTTHGAKMTKREFVLLSEAIPFIEREEMRGTAA